MPTKTVSRQQSQTPAQQLQLQQQRDVENGLYPNIPPERRSPQARPVRPPTLRQDTIDMEEIPLNQANAMQEPEDRRKMREIFDKVKQDSLSHSTFPRLCLSLPSFSVCVRVMNEFPCCPCRESCGESSKMTLSISPPFAYSPSPQPFPQPRLPACICMFLHAQSRSIFMHAPLRLRTRPMPVGRAGRPYRIIRTSAAAQWTASHTFACLFMLVLCKLTKRRGGGKGA